jgi:hypothetical protein
MSRYNNPQNGGDSDSDYDDDMTLKLQEYAAVRLTPKALNTSSHDQYGTSLISNYEDAAVLDGIVFQRDDKPQTWKVFSANKFFNLNPEDGKVYESFDEEDGYTGEMSSQDILDHPRVAGFSESFGGEDYFYTPVGAVVEAAGDIATNDELEVETEDGAIVVGGASMLTGNKTWVRTFAKKITEAGDSVVIDNGDAPTPRGEPDTNPKYDDHDWLAEDVELDSDLEGRPIELWITETTETMDDGEEVTYSTPNVEDVKTGEPVNIDNSTDGSDATDADTEKAAATDGGTATQSGGGSTGTGSPDEPGDADEGGMPDGVPDKLEDLLGYFATNMESQAADDIREFAKDEVDDPDEVDWDAAAEYVEEISA